MLRLFAVDSMAILFRGYFAMIRTPLINSKGLNTSGIRALLMQLIKIIEEEKPDFLAVTSDSVEPTFRHKRFPGYKATREKMPEDLAEQLPYLPKLLESLNLPYLKLPGYEADDIVGTLMSICKDRKIEGVMVTSDKDFMQLISENILMLNHRNELIGIPEVYEKFGCRPEQVIEVLGLMGDSSDNIPGVRGVGEKTARKLIGEFGNIKTVYDNIEKINGKSLKEKLEIDKENAFLSRELATIDCNVPLNLDLDSIKLRKTELYDNSELIYLLEELEFHTLLSRLKKKNRIISPSANQISITKNKKDIIDEDYSLFNFEENNELKYLEVECFQAKNINELKDFLNNIAEGSEISISFNFCGDHQLDFQLKGLAICLEPNRSLYIDLSQSINFKGQIWIEIKKLLESNTHSKVFYDLKKTIQLLRKLDVSINGIRGDIMLAGHMLDPSSRRYDLDYLLGRNLYMQRKSKESSEIKSKVNSLPIFSEIEEKNNFVEYCENSSIILLLHRKIDQQLKKTGMEAAYRNIEIPLTKTLADMEISGCCLNIGVMEKISHEFDYRLKEIRKKIVNLAGEEFNPNSVIELQKIIYEKFKLHEFYKVKPKKIKLGNKMSTDEETLEKLAGNELASTILDFRTLSKLKNTYIDQLPNYVHSSSGCIHTTFRQTGTATGRLSSENPNIQNIPIRSVEGRRIRDAFIPSESDRILISADYSQIELRVVAHFSKDPTFLDAYRKNLDIHSLTASTIYKLPVKEVTREMRSKSKEVNFGLIYRMGAEKLSIVTKTSKEEAKEFIERFFHKYNTIHALQEKFLEKARKEGFAETLFGRRRYLPDINKKGLLKNLSEGAAINTPIQGSAAEIIKLSMISIDHILREKKMKSKMILSVHDELVFDTLKEEELELCQIIKETMENVVGLEVPLLVEIGKGKTWLDAH